MHEQAFRFVARALREHAPTTSVVEIGSLVINGSVRALFGRVPYTGIDMRPGPGVDIVADGRDWQPPAPVDCVVCCEVLEHCPEPAAIVANAAAMLKPGGLFIVTAASNPRRPHSAIHGGPLEAGEHYANIDQNDLMEWLAAHFSDWTVEVDQDHGDVRGVGVK